MSILTNDISTISTNLIVESMIIVTGDKDVAALAYPANTSGRVNMLIFRDKLQFLLVDHMTNIIYDSYTHTYYGIERFTRDHDELKMNETVSYYFEQSKICQGEDAYYNIREMLLQADTSVEADVDGDGVESSVVGDHSFGVDYLGKYCHKNNDSTAYMNAHKGTTPDYYLAHTENGAREVKVLHWANTNLVEIPYLRSRAIHHEHVALHQGAVGDIVMWYGGELGDPKPDNLHPMNGSMITNKLSRYYGKTLRDLEGRTLGACHSYSSGHVQSIYEIGSASHTLAEAHLPRRSLTVSGATCYPKGSVSVVGLTNKFVWSGYDTHSHNMDGDSATGVYGGAAGTDAVLNNNDGSTDIDFTTGSNTHRHAVNISHEHSASFTGSATGISGQTAVLNRYSVQSAISNYQPTTMIPIYLVIY